MNILFEGKKSGQCGVTTVAIATAARLAFKGYKVLYIPVSNDIGYIRSWLGLTQEKDLTKSISIMYKFIEESSIKPSDIVSNSVKVNENLWLLDTRNTDLTDDMSAEDVEAAADALIGHDICKCGVCGANYVGDCDDHKCEEEPIIVANEEDFVEAEPADDENEYDDFSESLLFKHITEDVDDEELTLEEIETLKDEDFEAFDDFVEDEAETDQQLMDALSQGEEV